MCTYCGLKLIIRMYVVKTEVLVSVVYKKKVNCSIPSYVLTWRSKFDYYI